MSSIFEIPLGWIERMIEVSGSTTYVGYSRLREPTDGKWVVKRVVESSGTTPTLQTGTSGDNDAVANITSGNLTSVGNYTGICNLNISSSTQIIATFNADSSTTGSARIIVEAI